MLKTLEQRLQAYHPQRIKGERPRAAVLIPLHDEPEPRLLLTQRSARLSSHAGQVAFPGGKLDPGETLEECALRETEEEIGLPRTSITLIGRLSDCISINGIIVTPFVGLIPAQPTLAINPAEIDRLLEIPLARLIDDDRAWTDVIELDNADTLYVPSYTVADTQLWGLSAMMIIELLRVGFHVDVSLSHPPTAGDLRPRPPRRKRPYQQDTDS
ncbi:NUDIX hydrolase [Larsenimonas rhizosphaerae]|uniref:CoA pyrophosphatase n=1 Tax=Larsenimonas rhizosphaerae TaxID=2944682 RepID=A0AA41ZHP1_9GAMM|nr:CoA pyrophosphatase [Larsenimonas rhizosphaerae]MCM2131803.1 CoA pyrophosphatase [Larsenimonas rhizosphaerae]MCX2524881.1 CoA pyrophosphatase [Larsenimonas rhizosphaerae]